MFAYDAHTAPGYGWLMPLPDGGANIGIGTLASAGETPDAAHLHDLFDRFIAGAAWLTGATIADDPAPRSWPLALAPRYGPLVGDGVLLVGEAAALVGPMTGAGIYPAMRSGVWAAEALIAALRTGDLSRRALLPYERRVRRRFLPQHRAEAWAQRLLTDPARLRRLTNAVRPLPFTAPLGASLRAARQSRPSADASDEVHTSPQQALGDPKRFTFLSRGALELAKAVYGKIVDRIVPVSSSRAAEATKLTENIFRSVNIALVNELKVVYDAMGIDV